MIWVAIAVGGAIGSVARYSVSLLVLRLIGQVVPFAVAAINIIGCFGIGCAWGAITAARWGPSDVTRAFLFIGIFGGFTTFSSFGLDTFLLVREGRYLLATTNVAAQTIVGVMAVFAGHAVMSR